MLQQLNPGARFTAGTEIKVPAVQPFDADAPKPAPDSGGRRHNCDGFEGRVRAPGHTRRWHPRVLRAGHDGQRKGSAARGRLEDHLGQLETAVQLQSGSFWDAKPTDTKATIKPGPNNPVGIVWLDVNIEHYGIHGTPEPGRVGHTESHGCVRLTNWDAARLAALVKPGTPVQFR